MMLNRSYIIIAPPQHGKTTELRKLVLAHLREFPKGIALVHDVNGRFRNICARYETIAAYREAQAKSIAEGTQTFHRGASFACTYKEVAELAISIGRAHNNMDHVEVPIILAADESSLMNTSGSTHIAQIDLEIQANRAHLGIVPIYNGQRPSAFTQAFYDMTTDVLIFSQPSPKRTAALEEHLGLLEGTLDEVIGWPPFKHKHWKQGKGLV